MEQRRGKWKKGEGNGREGCYPKNSPTYVCDFLLIRHSKRAPILYRFRDIAGFYVYDPTPILR